MWEQVEPDTPLEDVLSLDDGTDRYFGLPGFACPLLLTDGCYTVLAVDGASL